MCVLLMRGPISCRWNGMQRTCCRVFNLSYHFFLLFCLISSYYVFLYSTLQYGFGTSVVAFYSFFPPDSFSHRCSYFKYIKGEYSCWGVKRFFSPQVMPLASGWVDLYMCWSAMVAGWKSTFPHAVGHPSPRQLAMELEGFLYTESSGHKGKTWARNS